MEIENNLQSLVSKLETHLNQNELAFQTQIRITSNSDDTELDDLFLGERGTGRELLEQVPVLRQLNEESAEVETKCLKQASTRLKAYLETLNEQIVKIVESESDEFLLVASKMDGFKGHMRDVKEAMLDYQTHFASEKAHTSQILTYLL